MSEWQENTLVLTVMGQWNHYPEEMYLSIELDFVGDKMKTWKMKKYESAVGTKQRPEKGKCFYIWHSNRLSSILNKANRVRTYTSRKHTMGNERNSCKHQVVWNVFSRYIYCGLRYPTPFSQPFLKVEGTVTHNIQVWIPFYHYLLF